MSGKQSSNHICKTQQSTACFITTLSGLKTKAELEAEGFELLTKDDFIRRLNEKFQEHDIRAQAYPDPDNDNRVKISCHPADAPALHDIMQAHTASEPITII